MTFSDSESDSCDGIDPKDKNFDFSKIFDTASKLKSAQLSKIRKGYEESPGFIKATQVYAERNNDWKDLTITQKIKKCEEFKEEGNKYFEKHDYAQALSSYSKGVSIFRYFEKKDERGEHLELKDHIKNGYILNSSSILFWDDENNFNKSKSLIISCILNCATASLSLRQHNDVIWCCKTVLEYDYMNVKALYRMCQSHEKLDTTLDLECALKYISRAKMIEPKNKAIKLKFKQIKSMLKKQNKKDQRQFQGLFDRGNIYDDKNIQIPNSKDIKRDCCTKLLSYCVIL